MLGDESERARKFESTVDWIAEDMDLARELIEVYRPYIQELIYTFHGVNVRELYARAETRRCGAPSVPPGQDRLGGLLDQCASARTATAYFSAARFAYQGPARICSSAIARWLRCSKTPPIAMAPASR